MINIDTKLQKYLNILFYSLVAIPIIIHITTVYHYALNIPREDDYDAVLSFFCRFKVASFYEQISLLFAQQGEHRSLFSKIIYISHYIIYGNINFRHMILFDILLLLAIFLLFVNFIKKCMPDNWQIPSLLLSLGLFDLNNFENADFDSAGLFNYSIIFLFLLSMLFYSFKNNKLVIIAAILQVILIYSGGNGMIGAFFIVIYTLLKKDKLRIFTASIMFIIFSPLYFYHFTNGNSIYFTLDVTKFFPYFIGSLGANFGIGLQFGVLAGVGLFLLLLYIMPYKKILQDSTLTPILCITGFVVVSLATMSVFRGKLPIEYSFSSRYLIYSHILIICVLIFLFLKVKKRWVQLITVFVMLFLYIHNYRGGKGGFDSFYTGMKTIEYCYPEGGREHVKQVAELSCKMGIYCIEQHRKD